jgi:hypothetical protein
MMIDLSYPPVPGINIACVYGMFLGILFGRGGAPSAPERLPRRARPLPARPRLDSPPGTT